jgi:glycosyltransferase involved in cell wall biosynthesis
MWEKSLPKISIILPTIGREEGINRCVDSILNLDYPQENIETLIIEDKPRLGLPKRLKEGVEKSTGEYIVYAADDMEFLPDCLLQALSCANEAALVTFNTGKLLEDEGNICEHFIIKKSFISKIGGEIFDTDFNHVGVDNLLWEKCKKLNQAKRCENARINHHHFSITGVKDEYYEASWNHDSLVKDRELFVKKMEELNANSPTLTFVKWWLSKYKNV